MLIPLLSLFLLLSSTGRLFGVDAVSCELAGKYFPRNPVSLTALIREFYSSAAVSVSQQSEIKAIIVPDGPIYYSGGVSAWAYKNLQGRNYNIIVILAPSHKAGLKKAKLLFADSFSTPLGFIPVASDLADSLSRIYPDLFEPGRDEFIGEPSIEVQLPFIQYTFGAQLILPVLVPDGEQKITGELSEIISEFVERRSALIVCVAGISVAQSKRSPVKIEDEIIERINDYDIVGLQEGINSLRYPVFGGASLVTTLLALKLKGEPKAKIVRYLNSKPVTLSEDTSSVVYIAGVIYEGINSQSDLSFCPNFDSTVVLDYAWECLKANFNKGEPSRFLHSPALRCSYGVGICLKYNDIIRGSSSHIQKDKTLAELIPELVKAAAFADVRFQPLRESELDSISIEISIITSFTELQSPSDFDLGEEGLYVSYASEAGILFPQVAKRFKLSKEEFMRQTCKKANLPLNCFLDKNVKFYSFRVKVFSK